MTEKLREGVTTGSCAAAAVHACVEKQLHGSCPDFVSIITPSGKSLSLPVIVFDDGFCGVRKDAGDDPDVTDGCLVKAFVHLGNKPGPVIFSAGDGIGTVTLPGLKIPVGEAAVNPVPRQMISKEIKALAGDVGAKVVLSIPGGEELAKKTFNPRLGIEGGLSILGTTGIVRPMSEEAVIASLMLDLSVAVSKGNKSLFFVLGETGERTVKTLYGDKYPCVLISNYIGKMLDEAKRLDVEEIIVAGFAGKLVKVAAGIMNTHSHVADGRRETICTFAGMDGVSPEDIQRLYDSKTMAQTETILERLGRNYLWRQIADRAAQNCELRVGGQIKTGFILLGSSGDVLGISSRAEEILYRDKRREKC